MRNINHCETIFQQFRALHACMRMMNESCPYKNRKCFKHCRLEIGRTQRLTEMFLNLHPWKKWLINFILEL